MSKRAYTSFMSLYKSSDEFTNTSTRGGKWNIPCDMYDEFLHLYCNHLNHGYLLSITEKHLDDRGPIVIDLDIKFNEKNHCIGDRVSDDELHNIGNVIKNGIMKLTKIKQNLTCYILRRPYISGHKDGIHIILPYVITDYSFQFSLRNIIMEEVSACISNVMNPCDEVYDKAVIKSNPWTLYGSTKLNDAGVRTPAYDIHLVMFCDESVRRGNMSLLDTVKLFSIRRIGMLTIPSFSIKPRNYINQCNEYEQCNINVTELESLVSHYNMSRVNNYSTWLAVGIALHNVSAKALVVWDNWSKLSKKYKVNECKKLWNSFGDKSNGLGMGSLIHWKNVDKK